MVGTNSCSTEKKYMAVEEKRFNDNSGGWQPGEFDPGKGTLLIETVEKKYQKQIEAFMIKNYPYKYEFVKIKKAEDIDKLAKYNDKNEYRFVLTVYDELRFTGRTPDSRAEIERHGMDMSRPPSVTRIVDFYFIDRKNNKSYNRSDRSSYVASKPLIKMLEYYLKKN